MKIISPLYRLRAFALASQGVLPRPAAFVHVRLSA